VRVKRWITPGDSIIQVHRAFKTGTPLRGRCDSMAA
jgi:hypothetical protein